MHRGFGGDWSDDFEPITAAGWEMYLQTLAAYHAHFAGQPAIYIEAEGPASSSAPEAWHTLLRALAPSIEVGAPIRINLRTDLIQGVVDYLTPQYLGLRTADALIRFHNRSGLGMTIAVSHRVYGRAIDAQSAHEAWEAWLSSAVSRASV